MSGLNYMGGFGAHVINNMSNFTVNLRPYRCTEEYNGWKIFLEDLTTESGQSLGDYVAGVLPDAPTADGLLAGIKVNGTFYSAAQKGWMVDGSNISSVMTHNGVSQYGTVNELLSKAYSKTMDLSGVVNNLSYELEETSNKMVPAPVNVDCAISGMAFTSGGVKSVGDVVYCQFIMEGLCDVTPNGIQEIFVLQEKRPPFSIWLDNYSAQVTYSYMKNGFSKQKIAIASVLRVFTNGSVVVGNGDVFNEIRSSGGTDIRVSAVTLCYSYLAV